MRSALVFVSALCFLPVGYAAAFTPMQCTSAHTAREKTVCASRDLSALDTRLNQAYDALPAQLTPESTMLVRADQRAWLAWLDKVCPAGNPAIDMHGCLTAQYNRRMEQLTEGIRRVDGILFFTRAHFVYTPGTLPKSGSDEARFDPGFGYGSYAWPQIDAPDRDHAAFNQAAYLAALRTETYSDKGHKATSFEDGTPPIGSIDADLTVFSANGQLVDVDLFASRYNWGGAHPTTDRYSLLWSTARQGALTTEDLFRPGSGWPSGLVQAAAAKLSKTDAGPNLWEGKELTDAIKTAMANPQQWDLSQQGLTLTFGQYQVTCYACGTPKILFSWDELKPYLNASFDPSLLPQRAPEEEAQ